MFKRLLALCLMLMMVCTLTVSVQAVSDGDIMTDRMEDVIALLDESPDDVSLVEVANLMNDNYEFAVAAYERLSDISVSLDFDIDMDDNMPSQELDDMCASEYVIYDFSNQTYEPYSVSADDKRNIDGMLRKQSRIGTQLDPDDVEFKNLVCKLFIKGPGGTYYVGSGAAITNFGIVTCAHNLYNHQNTLTDWPVGMWAKEIIIVPGYIGETAGYTEYENRRPSFATGNAPYGAYGMAVSESNENVSKSCVLMDSNYLTLSSVSGSANYYANVANVCYDWAVIQTAPGLEPIEGAISLRTLSDCLGETSTPDSISDYLRLYGYPEGNVRQTCVGSYYMNTGYVGAGALVDPGTHGMSGGPVFDNKYRLVGIYHGNTKDIRPRGVFRPIDDDLFYAILNFVWS